MRKWRRRVYFRICSGRALFNRTAETALLPEKKIWPSKILNKNDYFQTILVNKFKRSLKFHLKNKFPEELKVRTVYLQF